MGLVIFKDAGFLFIEEVKPIPRVADNYVLAEEDNSQAGLLRVDLSKDVDVPAVVVTYLDLSLFLVSQTRV